MKRCCGQLWNVESASGVDLESIRTLEREREKERKVKDEWVFQKGLREEKEAGLARERDVR